MSKLIELYPDADARVKQLVEQLEKFVDDYSAKYQLTPATMIGALEIVKLTLWKDTFDE